MQAPLAQSCPSAAEPHRQDSMRVTVQLSTVGNGQDPQSIGVWTLQETFTPDQFAAISTANCRPVMGAYLCGCCDLIAADAYAAAVNGTCRSSCTSQIGLSVPCPSTAPAPGEIQNKQVCCRALVTAQARSRQACILQSPEYSTHSHFDAMLGRLGAFASLRQSCQHVNLFCTRGKILAIPILRCITD